MSSVRQLALPNSLINLTAIYEMFHLPHTSLSWSFKVLGIVLSFLKSCEVRINSLIPLQRAVLNVSIVSGSISLLTTCLVIKPHCIFNPAPSVRMYFVYQIMMWTGAQSSESELNHQFTIMHEISYFSHNSYLINTSSLLQSSL